MLDFLFILDSPTVFRLTFHQALIGKEKVKVVFATTII